MKKIYHPYPPFDFKFYIDTDVLSTPERFPLAESDDSKAIADKNDFKYTPYLRGACNICGKQTLFFTKSLIHPRDYLVCMHCGSTSRYRSLARGILDAIECLTQKKIASLAEIKDVNLGRKIAIYDTQLPFSLGIVTYPIPYFLSLSENIELYLSDFNCKKDRVGVNGEFISRQDLQRLTYKSEKFDIVITSDVMEHVRLPNRAHAEISRVTKNHGFYIFTVPHFRHTYETHHLIKIHDEEDPQKDENLVEPVYHGDPNSSDGAVVYQVFGLDIDEQLKLLSFDTKYSNETIQGSGIVETELFFCQKNDENALRPAQTLSSHAPTKVSFFKRLLNF